MDVEFLRMKLKPAAALWQMYHNMQVENGFQEERG
jgi:hypothetical protein